MRAFNKKRLYRIIFFADTKAGKRFDVVLLWLILASVLVVTFESIPYLKERFNLSLKVIEWVFTIAFTIEYFLRIYCAPNKKRYIFSFYGIVDLVAILPNYLAIVLTGGQYFATVRILRLLRVFRILKLTTFLENAQSLRKAIRSSVYKISIFMLFVLVMVLVIGSIMYVVEGPKHGYTSIPVSIYWTIVTITTVGYGDITPQTTLGQILASLIMLMGYSIIAVPTGIVSAELTKESNDERNFTSCPNCAYVNKNVNNYCSNCGTSLK